ncbi:metal-dependent transcriptional regulator [Roseivirga sp.]|uniref:metal-dependent transcriptional regulator n=1 Tax=Roseivirga sp. TaxID=1964215 RepID=UPI003B517F31
MYSLSEENYLKAIYHLSNQGEDSVNTNAIAEEMKTAPASVSDMIRKLSKKKLVEYQKYRGVRISKKGKEIALKVIRKHRLWEVFLVEKLNFKWDEVHDVAEQLEHIQSGQLIERLDEHLGFPKFDPHGDPIPNANGELAPIPTTTLSMLKPGDKCRVVCAKDSSSDLLLYLDKINISLGAKLEVTDFHDFDASFSIQIDGANPITLSSKVTEHIIVEEL